MLTFQPRGERPSGHDYCGYTLAPHRKQCDACTMAKRRCDAKDRCSLCTKRGRPCIYSSSQIGTIRYAETSSAGFFKDFVARRKPAILDGSLSESEGWRADKWTNEYLREKAGDAEVQVECRGGEGERFGQGQEKTMNFGAFLEQLERKSVLYYLTTQELGVDAGGRPRLMSGPLDKLKADFPLRPKLAGSLVPQNVNLWMGYSEGEGSSSGLHHDFHDNLYLLLRGRKRFRLFSPADAHRMYVEGELVKVHKNGRINYKGKETLADGSDPLAETAANAAELVDIAARRAEEVASNVLEGAHAPTAEPSLDSSAGAGAGSDGGSDQLKLDSHKSEEEVAAAQAAVERGESGAAERLAVAEEELEKALEAVLDAECAGGGGFGDGISGDESSDSDGGPGFFDGIDDNPSEEVFAAAVSRGAARRGGRGVDNGVSSNGRDSHGGDGRVIANDGERSGDSAGGVSNGNGTHHDAIADDAAPARSEETVAAGAHNGSSTETETPQSTAEGEQRRAVEGEANGPKNDARSRKRKNCSGQGGQGVEEAEETVSKGAPANFSKVDPSLPRSELEKRFPLFLDAVCCTVDLKAGQMLYLPAGWFHEVSSLASEDGHMAFNYWFHPPDTGGEGDDACDPSAPYASSFWQRDFDARMSEEMGAEG